MVGSFGSNTAFLLFVSYSPQTLKKTTAPVVLPRMSLRPKKPVWTKRTSGLPQYYKDKLPSNNYTKLGLSAPAWLGKRGKTAIKVLVGLAVTYLFVSWLGGGSDVQPARRPAPPHVASGTKLWNERRDEVRTAFKASWDHYSKTAWGYDVYAPIAGKGSNMHPEGPMGWIIVDSLDSLALMGMREELEDATSWVAHELTFDAPVMAHTFETTIRMLGGLLSAYYLTENEVFSEKAVHLGNKLLAAFNTKTGLPASMVNLQSGALRFDRDGISTAEVATLQLEFKYLASITGEKMYWDVADKVMEAVDVANNSPVLNKYDGLVPILMDQNTGLYNTDLIRLGSRGDSYYEYLLKQYLQTGEEKYLDMYNESFEGIKKHLVGHSQPNNYLFLGELERGLGGTLSNKMDHLVCFFGGLFALGATNGLTLKEAQQMDWWSPQHEEQLNYGAELGKTCYHMYHDVPPTGLAPEIAVFNTYEEPKKYAPADALWSQDGDFFVKATDTHNLQRPETVETLYYLYKITGDPKYREWGWEIFQSFEAHTAIGGPHHLGGFKGPLRYTSLKNVFASTDKRKYADNMESFWLAETLKYLYLLFSDEDMPGGEQWKKWNMNNVVFNTEAHPLPRLDGVKFRSEWIPKAKQGNKTEQKVAAKPIPETEADNREEPADSNLKHIDETIASDLKPNTDSKLSPSKPKAEPPSGELKDFDFSEDIQDAKADADAQASSEEAFDKSKKVAERMLANGEQPMAKGKVAKPLNEQAQEVQEETIDSIDDIDPALEAELF